MRKELLKLICFIVTDGGIYEKRNQIYFDTTDEKLLKEFIKTARENSVKHLFISNGHGTKTVYFYSKRLCEKIRSLVGKTKDLPLQEIVKLPKKDIRELLQILFSTDGGVSFSMSCSKDKKRRFHRKITFTSKNRKNLRIVNQLLKLFGIEGRIQKNNDLEIKGKENLEKFRDLIGFIEGTKITKKSKVWHGIEKNKLLVLCIDSYRYARGE